MQLALCTLTLLHVLSKCSVNAQVQIPLANFDEDEDYVSSQRMQPRIYGGTEVDPPGKYPFMVNVYEYQYVDFGPKINKCGGSLIYPNVVLTAAHCVDPVSGVRIGKHNLYQEEADTEEFDISEVIVHPEYTDSIGNTAPRYDFALLVLDGASKYDTIALDDGVSYPLNSGDAVNIVGWGKTESQSASTVLLHTEIDYLTNQQCMGYWGNSIQDDMLCLHTVGGTGACTGDSGGPAFIESSSGQKFVQIGASSWGASACSSAPSVYARVSEVYDWIQSALASVPTMTPTISPAPTMSFVPSFSLSPTDSPTYNPTVIPSTMPSMIPSTAPSFSPSALPTSSPSHAPSRVPSEHPTSSPTMSPSANPSVTPTSIPSVTPSSRPSISLRPTMIPTFHPSTPPSVVPSVAPSRVPSSTPSALPTSNPSRSLSPSLYFSAMPTRIPSVTSGSLKLRDARQMYRGAFFVLMGMIVVML